MSDDTVKKIVLTGSAAESMSPSRHDGGKPVRGRGSRKKKGFEHTAITKVGAGMSPGTLDQLRSTSVPGAVSTNAAPVRDNIPVLGAAQQIRIGGVREAAPAAVEKETAVAPVQKVILAKSAKTKKVFLAPAPTVKNESKPSTKKRKTIKRINISIGGPSLKKAKTLKKKSSSKTLEEVKTALENAGLIKSDSKAPEDVLRQMYSDYMVLKKRAL
jgi:hypothetical protein